MSSHARTGRIPCSYVQKHGNVGTAGLTHQMVVIERLLVDHSTEQFARQLQYIIEQLHSGSAVAAALVFASVMAPSLIGAWLAGRVSAVKAQYLGMFAFTHRAQLK